MAKAMVLRLAVGLALSAVAPALAASAGDEAQAKSQMEAAGYADVSRLHEANEGEWMADATKDGHPVMITLRRDGTVALREKVDVPPPAPPPAPVEGGSSGAPGGAPAGAPPATSGAAKP